MATAVIESGKVPLIYGKIQKIREQVGAVRKEGSGGVPYNFRGVDQVVNAIYPALNEHQVVIYPISAQRTLTQRLVGGTEKNGVLVGQKLMSTSDLILGLRIVATEDGSSIDVEVAGESQDYSDKSTAQAHSVAYRIALLQTFTLPTDAPDPELNQEKPGGVEDVVSHPTGPSAIDLQTRIKAYVKDGAPNASTGEVGPIGGTEIDAIGLRVIRDSGNGSWDKYLKDDAGKKALKDAKWKTDAAVLLAVVSEIEAGKRS